MDDYNTFLWIFVMEELTGNRGMFEAKILYDYKILNFIVNNLC